MSPTKASIGPWPVAWGVTVRPRWRANRTVSTTSAAEAASTATWGCTGMDRFQAATMSPKAASCGVATRPATRSRSSTYDDFGAAVLTVAGAGRASVMVWSFMVTPLDVVPGRGSVPVQTPRDLRGRICARAHGFAIDGAGGQHHESASIAAVAASVQATDNALKNRRSPPWPTAADRDPLRTAGATPTRSKLLTPYAPMSADVSPTPRTPKTSPRTP